MVAPSELVGAEGARPTEPVISVPLVEQFQDCSLRLAPSGSIVVAGVDTHISGRVLGLEVYVALYNSGAVTHKTVEILYRSRPYAMGSAGRQVSTRIATGVVAMHIDIGGALVWRLI